MASEDSKAAVGYSASASYPVTFSVVYPEGLSRRKGVQRAIGTLVTWIVPAGLGYVSAVFFLGVPIIIGSLIAAAVIGLPLYLAARIRAKGRSRFLAEDGPRLERYSRRAIAAASYALFLTDAPPAEAEGRSVRLEFRRGGSGWLHAASKPVLLLPHIVLLAWFAFPFMVIVPVCIIAAVCFRRYPRPFFRYTVGYLRWIARALAYWLSLTDRYPPSPSGKRRRADAPGYATMALDAWP